MITIIKDFYSPLDNDHRTIRIYTPPSYETGEKNYPVLYAFDGQNLFSHPESAKYDTWCVNPTLERLYENKEIRREWIVVAVDHRIDRLTEYTFHPFPDAGITEPMGLKTLRTFTDSIKPYIDSNYRTLKTAENTAIMGSSLGGLLSLFFGHKRPDIFGNIAAFSPTVSWSDWEILKLWNSKPALPVKIYLDVGTKEQFTTYGVYLDYPAATDIFVNNLEKIGFNNKNLKYVVEEDAVHYEIDWARRFPGMAKFLLN